MRNATAALCLSLAAPAAGCARARDAVTATVATPDAPTTPTASMARLRFAQLAPDAPAIDVCISAHGAHQWLGPLLKATGVDENGLAYGQVTTYRMVLAARYDLRVVQGYETSCARTLLDATALPPLPAGASVTVAALGFVEPPPGASAFTLKSYLDDTSAAATVVALRFVHAAPDAPALGLGTSASGRFTPLFADVSYGEVGTSATPASDDNGYAPLSAASAPSALSVRARGDATDLSTVTLPAALTGAAATVFAVGDASGAPKPLQALVCTDDLATPGPLARCSASP